MLATIEREWGLVLGDEFASAKAARIAAAFDTDLTAVEGVEAVLRDLDAAGVRRCVASSSALDRVRASLRLTGLDRYLEPHLFSAEMVSRGKPFPDLFLHAAATMGFEPSRCIVVEDSPHGVAAAVAAGISVVGFTAGRHCPEGLADRLRSAGAHEVVASSHALAGVLGIRRRL